MEKNSALLTNHFDLFKYLKALRSKFVYVSNYISKYIKKIIVEFNLHSALIDVKRILFLNDSQFQNFKY